MHRLSAVAGCPDDPGSFVEQPPAPVLLLSSADTDLVALDRLISDEPELLGCELRGLNLTYLSHPAVIDHYLASTARAAQLIVVRLLGGRGHWSYGLEAVQRWAQAAKAPGGRRMLLVLAGTEDEDRALASLSTTDPELVINLAGCFRQGGTANLRQALCCFRDLIGGREPAPPTPQPLPDPHPWDWRPDPGGRVGLILYRALFQASDLALMEACLKALRDQGLAPRALWVSGLRDPAVQRGVGDLLVREGVELVLCCTAFASVQVAEAGLGSPLWERLGVPVLQVLTSGRSRQSWASSSIGLGPTELGLQIALPELDGRITTRIGAFKESPLSSERLASALPRFQPDYERLDWIAELAARWIRLRRTPTGQRRVALVLANYPNRNSRVANGVGLDTPASVAAMLGWLSQVGYSLGEDLPGDGQVLIERLLAVRSNDPESGHRPPLDHLSLSVYKHWYASLPASGRQRLESVWGAPECDRSLEPTAEGTPGFPIRGLRFGTVALLLQPERGYDQDPSLNYHAPDLPPTHAYLAQYLWLRQSFASDVVVHVGKHGNLEWLPGKGLGLSASCYPEWALGPLPHLYPFIVNDPGEGSQAKRRSQAVILDHLTPPLGRAELHGELLELEGLLDEYWEAVQLGGERASLLRDRLATRLEYLELPGGRDEGLERRLEAADGYLCELKEAQIRLGLHVYGQLPQPALLGELLQSLARAPSADRPGLTQALARDLGLALDPWSDPDDGLIDAGDRDRLAALAPGSSLRLVGDAVAVLERMASGLLQPLIHGGVGKTPPSPTGAGAATAEALLRIRGELLPRLLACAEAERMALLRGLAGERIAAGPSGAPTRGRPDVLPTGRNFFSVDLRGLPTEAAWDLGRRSAELLLELHLLDEGDHLQRIALSVWGTATMRNGGEDIAQALALMGVRPVWDGPTRRLVDLEVIRPELLERPRVDVTLRISGLFRDAFPQLVGWFNRACQLVGALDEPADLNPLAESARREGHTGRVYGSAPGAYGAGLQALIDSGHWETREDLGNAFLTWSAWRYDSGSSDGSGCSPIEAHGDRTGLEQRLRNVQVVMHNQDNREHDLFDSDDYYQFHGGLSAAVQTLTGQAPSMWFGDHSRHSRPRVHRLEREFDKVLRSRLLNPRWIEAMQRHGYKGGFEMAASLDYLFAYDASTGRVPDWGYEKIAEAWLGDPGVRDFLQRFNPWALRDMAERLLEAHHRDLWQGASPQLLEELRVIVLQSEAQIEAR
ncbi:MAG: cobaltochelatase subunit CobN [Cyanobacteriota bacterium]|nr:cobaltochelatase subunit CobN [Cyanobacteriota bacterium]